MCVCMWTGAGGGEGKVVESVYNNIDDRAQDEVHES